MEKAESQLMLRVKQSSIKDGPRSRNLIKHSELLFSTRRREYEKNPSQGGIGYVPFRCDKIIITTISKCQTHPFLWPFSHFVVLLSSFFTGLTRNLARWCGWCLDKISGCGMATQRAQCISRPCPSGMDESGGNVIVRWFTNAHVRWKITPEKVNNKNKKKVESEEAPLTMLDYIVESIC